MSSPQQVSAALLQEIRERGRDALIEQLTRERDQARAARDKLIEANERLTRERDEAEQLAERDREVDGTEAGKLPFGSVVVRLGRDGQVIGVPVVVGDGAGRERLFYPHARFRVVYQPRGRTSDL